MNSNILTTSEIGSLIIAQKDLKFYKSSRTNKPEYMDEPKLNAKLHIWFRKIMNIDVIPRFEKLYWKKKIFGYAKPCVDLALSKYRDLLFDFLNTPMSNVDYTVFSNRFLYWKNKPKTIDIKFVPKDKEIDPMEQASEELLRKDGVYGYIDE